MKKKNQEERKGEKKKQDKGKKGVIKRYCTRHKHTGTLDKFNAHTLGVISLTFAPAKEFRV